MRVRRWVNITPTYEVLWRTEAAGNKPELMQFEDKQTSTRYARGNQLGGIKESTNFCQHGQVRRWTAHLIARQVTENSAG